MSQNTTGNVYTYHKPKAPTQCTLCGIGIGINEGCTLVKNKSLHKSAIICSDCLATMIHITKQHTPTDIHTNTLTPTTETPDHG